MAGKKTAVSLHLRTGEARRDPGHARSPRCAVAAYWLTTFSFKIACMVFPLFYWYFGIVIMDARLPHIIACFVPYYIGTQLFLNFVSPRMFVPILNDISQLVGAWEIGRSAMTGLIRLHGHAFKVTMKGGDRRKAVVQWPLMRRFVVLFAATVLGLLVGLVSDSFFEARAGEAKAVILFWTLYNLLVLGAPSSFASNCPAMPRSSDSPPSGSGYEPRRASVRSG